MLADVAIDVGVVGLDGAAVVVGQVVAVDYSHFQRVARCGQSIV